MRWVTVFTEQGPRACGVVQGQYVDVNGADPGLPSSVRGLLGLEPDRLRQAWTALAGGRVAYDPAKSRLLPPVPDPRKIICIGLNYRDHAAESGVPIPAEPVLFSKYPTTLIGHRAPIVLPRSARRSITRPSWWSSSAGAAGTSPGDKAREHVGGYTVGHDVSARDWQLNKPGKQWMAGKTFDTFAPTGPELVTADEVPDPHDLGIRLRLNGQTMQDSSTKPAHLRDRRADRVPVAGLDARARRPDLHRHAARRRHGPQAPGLAQARRCRRGRDRRPGNTAESCRCRG